MRKITDEEYKRYAKRDNVLGEMFVLIDEIAERVKNNKYTKGTKYEFALKLIHLSEKYSIGRLDEQ